CEAAARRAAAEGVRAKRPSPGNSRSKLRCRVTPVAPPLAFVRPVATGWAGESFGLADCDCEAAGESTATDSASAVAADFERASCGAEADADGTADGTAAARAGASGSTLG